MIDTTKTIETTKKAFFAAVGAPVVTARKVSAKWSELLELLQERRESLSEEARKEFDQWASEGHKLVERFNDQPMVEQIAAKIEDLDVEGQVGKLRDQLDDMMASWRKGFRPEAEKVVVEEPAAKKAPAKKPAAKKPAAAAK